MSFHLQVRFQRDDSPYHIWEVWRENGEVRVNITTGFCYPYGFTQAEVGPVIAELYKRLAGQIASVMVTPAYEPRDPNDETARK